MQSEVEPAFREGARPAGVCALHTGLWGLLSGDPKASMVGYGRGGVLGLQNDPETREMISLLSFSSHEAREMPTILCPLTLNQTVQGVGPVRDPFYRDEPESMWRRAEASSELVCPSCCNFEKETIFAALNRI